MNWKKYERIENYILWKRPFSYHAKAYVQNYESIFILKSIIFSTVWHHTGSKKVML